MNEKKIESAKADLTPLQYLDAIFGSGGIEQMSHIAVPVSKLREIWDALRSAKAVPNEPKVQGVGAALAQLQNKLAGIWAEHEDLIRRDVRVFDALPYALDESDVYYLNSELLGTTRDTVTGETQVRAIGLAASVLASAGIREL